MTPEDAKLILTYADCDMNAAEAGRRLYMTPGSVKNHCERIRKATGKNPRCFWDLTVLAEQAWRTLQQEKGLTPHA